jgi:DNA-directed RNA polymerase specialized sigma24 family protein
MQNQNDLKSGNESKVDKVDTAYKIVAKHKHYIECCAVHYCNSRQCLQDEKHEATLDVLFQLAKQPNDDRRYICGIVRNGVMRRARDAKREELKRNRYRQRQQPYTSDKWVEQQHNILRVLTALQLMPLKARSIVIAHFFREESIEEIANQLHISTMAVYGQLWTQFKRVREIMRHLP